MTPTGDQRESGGGRREYDPDGPFAVLRAELMREIEKSASRTRHGLREEFGSTMVKIEAAVAKGQAQSSQEHTAALDAINKLGIDVRLMARDLEDVKPLVDEVAALKTHDDVDEARSSTRTELIEAFAQQKLATRHWNLAVIGAITAATALLLQHIPH